MIRISIVILLVAGLIFASAPVNADEPVMEVTNYDQLPESGILIVISSNPFYVPAGWKAYVSEIVTSRKPGSMESEIKLALQDSTFEATTLPFILGGSENDYKTVGVWKGVAPSSYDRIIKAGEFPAVMGYVKGKAAPAAIPTATAPAVPTSPPVKVTLAQPISDENSGPDWLRIIIGIIALIVIIGGGLRLLWWKAGQLPKDQDDYHFRN